MEKLEKVKSPKVQAGHYKLFNEKLDMEKISKNLEDWNPSHFKPFVTHTPKDYEDKNRVVDPKKSGKI